MKKLILNNLDNICSFGFGVYLAVIGYHLLTWQFWVGMLMYIIFGLINKLDGLARG